MYIRKLKIESINQNRIIRDVTFKKNLNLIVDDTPITFQTETGNSVGKTTVLQLIDFCLGGKEEKITKDKESNQELKHIKEFLLNNEILITLSLSKQFSSNVDIQIRRNFLKRNKKIMEINGKNFIKDKEFLKALEKLIIGTRNEEKPSLRHILAHNIRYTDDRISNTLKMISSHTTSSEYETLFLYMFGFKVFDRTPLIKKLKIEETFKKKLLEDKDKTQLELQLGMIENNIEDLEKRKKNLVINEHYEKDLEKINYYKYNILKFSKKISELELRKNLLEETKEELESDISNLDIKLLNNLYNQATKYDLTQINKKFEEIVKYHNEMILEKIKFIVNDIPSLENEINSLKNILEKESKLKKELEKKIKYSNSLEDLEKIISELNEEFRKKGEIEKAITQIKNSENRIKIINEELNGVDRDIFTEEFKEKLKKQLLNFNEYFSKVSKELYNEEYGISYKIKEDKKTKKNIYEFESFNSNVSSGKKQGEIICFDLAYILFARKNNIPHVDFILNDKKELMSDNQLIKVSMFAERHNIQLIFSILKDKLPEQLNNKKYIILELSQKNKLFKIENN